LGVVGAVDCEHGAVLVQTGQRLGEDLGRGIEIDEALQASRESIVLPTAGSAQQGSI
jgi:hypothetical protein